MSPKRYLLRRRMAFVRRALRAAEPDAVTVTDVATRYGFGQLGRFAVGYRRLFGELPPDTLQRRSLEQRRSCQKCIDSRSAPYDNHHGG
jgi:AraC-like DNA-binding protein